MTTSFSQTRNELIRNAFETCGAYGIGRTISAEDITYASDTLNMMVKGWSTEGLHLFEKTEGVLYLVPGTSEYLLGSTAKITNASDEIIVVLDGDHASGSSTLTVEDLTGVAALDQIGVLLDDKTIFWTTVVSAVGVTITLTAPITGAASSGNLVYTYTTAAEKPLRVLDCRRRSGSGENTLDLPVQMIGYQQYQSFPVKNTGTTPTQASYNPQGSYGSLYLWPCPSDGANRIMYTYERKVNDLNNTSDTFDFPNEWLETIKYQLAMRLAGPFGKGSRLADLVPMGSIMLENLKNWDAEHTNIQLEPEI